MMDDRPEPDDGVASLFAVVDAALGDGADAPDSLRGDVLATALDRRQPGLALGRPDPTTPIAAFRATVEDMRVLLASLGPDDWRATPRPPHADVAALIAHLAGMEALTRAWLVGPAPDPAAVADHLQATAPMVAELGGHPGPAVAERWHELALLAADAATDAPPGHTLVAHDLPTDTEGLLVLRTFELWSHMHDVGDAIGRPAPELDAARMAMMSERFVAVLPFALALRGATAPGRTARLVLTGPAGGCYTVPLHPGDGPGEPDTTIVVDTVELCRRAARRLEVDELPVTIEGDEALAAQILAAADALARD